MIADDAIGEFKIYLYLIKPEICFFLILTCIIKHTNQPHQLLHCLLKCTVVLCTRRYRGVTWQTETTQSSSEGP